ncbi:transcription elongation factor A protein 2-like [Octopus sinensis]|uniref:Transcription elongation factor A protein 2-like n=1 Tax=Octopus sinensis TaxID=2607531 RepID=A0A6P7U045_9MOLL|nr:transcription elongation factor A protein 2-like [Octopus sinensis]
MTVNKIRKETSNKSISLLAKTLILFWKKNASVPPNKPQVEQGAIHLVDTIREKSRSMFLDAVEGSPQGGNFEEICRQIEEQIFLTSKTEAEYRKGVRTRVINLRDRRNPELRGAVLTGVISPREFATMSAEVDFGGIGRTWLTES